MVGETTRGFDLAAPGNGYHVFAGKDASRGLGMSSLKPEDAVSDYSTLTEAQMKVLNDWVCQTVACADANRHYSLNIIRSDTTSLANLFRRSTSSCNVLQCVLWDLSLFPPRLASSRVR